jgi:hypothetical protein
MYIITTINSLKKNKYRNEFYEKKNAFRNFHRVEEILLYLQDHKHGKQAMTVKRKKNFVVCRIWQCNLFFQINELVH